VEVTGAAATPPNAELVLQLVADPRWTDELPATPGPVLHLRLGLAAASENDRRAIDLHLIDGRPQAAGCIDGPCEAEDRAELRVAPDRLGRLIDPAVADPILDLLAPPGAHRASFDVLMYLGGIMLTWVAPLRQAARLSG
jgi:hypothetical protein